jgi:hypothetical protein
MYLDDIVARANGECDKFLATYPHGSQIKEAEALEPLMRAANLVLAALNFAYSIRKDIGVSVELGSFEKKLDGLNITKTTTSLILLQDGTILKQTEQVCRDLGYEQTEQQILTTVEELLAQGVSAKAIVENLKKFFLDPQRDSEELADGVIN